jgi:excisionase family DNA binding protein
MEPEPEGEEEVLGETMAAAEVAAHLGISRHRVYRAVRRGKLPCDRVGRSLRFRRLFADAWWLSRTWTQADRARLHRRLRAHAVRLGITEEDILRACYEVRHGSADDVSS